MRSTLELDLAVTATKAESDLAVEVIVSAMCADADYLKMRCRPEVMALFERGILKEETSP